MSANLKYPVTGSLVEIKYNGDPIGFAQALKIDKKIDYQTVRVLGKVYPRTFVISFVTVTGGFALADTGDMSGLTLVFQEILDSCRSSSPSAWPSFDLVGSAKPLEYSDPRWPEASMNDAPNYVVRECRIINLTTEVDVSGKLLATNISFIGRYLAIGDNINLT